MSPDRSGATQEVAAVAARLMLCLFCVAVLLWMPGQRAWARAALDRDLILKVDGKRVFVLGCYENPGTDAGLAELAAAGFNLVHAPASQEALDRLAAHGLWGWVNLGDNLDLSEAAPQRSKALTEVVESLRAHPALLAWESPDEALWNIYYSAVLREGAEHDRLRRLVQERKGDALEAAWAELEAARDAGDPQGEATLRKQLYPLLDEQPPNWPYTLAEAPARAHRAAVGFQEGYRLLKRLDAGHPLWFNHAPRNTVAALAEFNRACDICGCDIYPVPEGYTGHSDLHDRSLAAVGAYTERMKAAGPGKAVWMVLQGFGWWDLRSPEDRKAHPQDQDRGRRPRYDETRFMAYDAIARGAAGVLYWGTQYVEKDSTFWADLKRVVGELAALRPLWEAPTLAWRPRVEIVEAGPSYERGIQVIAKKYEGALYLLVVNEDPDAAAFTLRGMQAYNDARMRRLFEGDAVAVKDGAISGAIRGHGVSIYAGGAAFDHLSF